jgi:predicted nucleic acid-binding protein
MAVLLDTNILLRLSQPNHPHNPIVEQALTVLRSRGEILHIVSQNLVEFWAVATRPLTENGLGVSVDETAGEIASLKRLFDLLPEVPLQSEWERLVSTYRVSGKNTHDARLVAAMMVHSIGNILTLNTPDFVRYPAITVIDPRALV